MLLPVVIEALEQDLLLELDPAVLGNLARFLLDLRIRQRLEPFDEHLGLDRFFLDPRLERRRQGEHLLDPLGQQSEIPLLGIAIGRDRLADDRVDRLGAHVGDDVADRRGVHDVRALLVDDLALVVHHVVIFDDLLADVVVARLDLLLRGLDRFGDPWADDRLAVGEVLVHQAREHRLRAEDAQQVVVEAQVEAAEARIALAARAAAQLVVDPAALVALGAEHEQAAGGDHALLLLGHLLPDLLLRLLARGARLHCRELVVDAEFDIAAELDVGASAGHVGGDRHRPGPAGLGDDMGLALMLARVQHGVLDLLLLEPFGEELGFLDRDGADEDRLAALLLLADRLDDSPELVVLVLVEFVVVVASPDRAVGRDRDHVHLVDVVEFGRLGGRGAGHARKLRIHTEIILEGDRGQSLVLRLDVDAFLGLDRLVKAVGPAAAVHHPPGEGVDDHHLPFLDDIIDVPLEGDVGLQRLVEVVDHLGVLEIVEVGADQKAFRLQQALHPLGAVLGQKDALVLLVIFVILGRNRLHDPVERDVELGLVVGRPRDDQRRARLVDQDRIHLVDDRIAERPLDHLLAVELHVVAQIIEAELVVGAVGDVRVVGVPALEIGDVGDDHAHGEAEEAVDLAHPVGVALGEIIVDGNDVDALALERVEIDRQGRDQRLALAGAHLGDLAAVEDDSADQLNVVMALAERALRGLTDRREGFGKDVVESLAGREAFLEPGGLALELLVAQRLDGGLERVDLVDDLAERADVAVVRRPENGFGESGEHVGILKFVRCSPAGGRSLGKRDREGAEDAPRAHSIRRSA